MKWFLEDLIGAVSIFVFLFAGLWFSELTEPHVRTPFEQQE